VGGNELTKTRKRTKIRSAKAQQKSAISPVMIAGVAVAAILVVVGLVLISNRSTSAEPVDVSRYPTLGDANAPVTMIEYSDYG
jgi:protein-disulfide isomerase